MKNFKIGDWVEVRRKSRFKGGKKYRADNGRGSNETTFFISNLPEGITDSRFKESFAGFGWLSDAYIARKRDRGGNWFGFIRFKDVKEVSKLLMELSNVRLDGAKLCVNIAKYNKDGAKQMQLGVGEQRRNYSGNFRIRENKDYADTPSFQGGHGSYKDALVGKKLPIRLTATAMNVAKWWRDYSLVALCNDIETLNNVEDVINGLGIVGGTARYMGGLRILLTLPSIEYGRKILIEKKEELDKWFSHIEVWHGQVYDYQRIACIKVYGVPATLWGPEIFNLIGVKFGQLLYGSNASYSDCNLTYENLLILTSRFDKILGDVSVVWDDRCFNIHVSEGVEDWVPAFLGKQSEIDAHRSWVGQGLPEKGPHEWKENSHIHGELEEGEIQENNYDVPNIVASDGGQQLHGSADVIITDNNSNLNPIGGPVYVDMEEINGPIIEEICNESGPMLPR
ncbi:hypothetical protein E3N88_09786 [Mikania micrantha]|uniref:RRM domain-containing protein n=1 Tax=Mikania micrantha TaxID=192012 RepID=A0A5N6PK20_9ASTR|nr:hypothetical protein E3N88_09786 [Mikania micrantha]